MSGVELVVEILSLLKMAYNAYLQVKENGAEIKRLLDRCLAFEPTIKDLQRAANEGDRKNVPLERLKNVLEMAVKFVTKFNETTTWRTMMKVAKRKEYCHRLADMNNQLNMCAQDLTLATVASQARQRHEDLEDFKTQTHAILHEALEDMKKSQEVTDSALDELKKDIQDNQSVMEDYFKRRNYSPLQAAEFQSLSNVVIQALEGKFKEIKDSLVHVEADVNQLLGLVKAEHRLLLDMNEVCAKLHLKMLFSPFKHFSSSPS